MGANAVVHLNPSGPCSLCPCQPPSTPLPPQIIDVNYYPVESARNSNMRHRPIGIGVQARPPPTSTLCGGRPRTRPPAARPPTAPPHHALPSPVVPHPTTSSPQGLADAFLLLGLPFDSPEARQLNKEIFETLYYAALEAGRGGRLVGRGPLGLGFVAWRAPGWCWEARSFHTAPAVEVRGAFGRVGRPLAVGPRGAW